jgi:phytoene synthase
MTPDDYCADKLRRSASNFSASFYFLPQHRRRALTALYAFCREIDDVVDECSDPSLAQATLDWWRKEISATGNAQPSHPVTRALSGVSDFFSPSCEQWGELIDGMEMDLNFHRYPDFKTLQLYCHRVAGVVGLMAADIFGYTDRSTLKYAHTLGIAFQLINIIRDVGEDARRGRIYIPQDEIAQFNVQESDILNARPSLPFERLMTYQVERARSTLQRAISLLPPVDRRAQISGLMMAAIYADLLDAIEEDGLRVLTHRVSLPTIRKLWLALRTWLAR